jgi:hypothetical protein
MNQRGTWRSNLHRPFMNERPEWGSGAQWRPVRRARRRQGRLTRVEPIARSGGPSTTRSSPT